MLPKKICSEIEENTITNCLECMLTSYLSLNFHAYNILPQEINQMRVEKHVSIHQFINL